jgi:hypothetical protein
VRLRAGRAREWMTEQLGWRVAHVQGRSAHGGISRDFRQNRPEDVSGALAFAAGTHSERRFASIFVTAPDGLTLHVRRYGGPAVTEGRLARSVGEQRQAATVAHSSQLSGSYQWAHPQRCVVIGPLKSLASLIQ